MPFLYGHPTVPADTPGLPDSDSGRHTELPPDLCAVLADTINGQPDQQFVIVPDQIVAVTVHDDIDMMTGDTYTVCEVEANDPEGTAWNFTLTVSPT